MNRPELELNALSNGEAEAKSQETGEPRPQQHVAAAAENEIEEDEEEEEEEEEEGYRGNIADLQQPVNSRMDISPDERSIAISIREAIRASEHIDPISDFMCAQLALVDGDNLEKSLERAYHLQCFREEYGVLDSVVDGRRIFEEYMSLMPGFLLCFADDMTVGNNVMIYDLSRFDLRAVRSSEQKRTVLGGAYYTLCCFCPDFEAIRTGAISVCEAEGYDWKRNMDLNTFKLIASDIAADYPVNFTRIKYFHSGTTMNLVVSMLKPLLSDNMRGVIEMGCIFEERLDRIYLVPSREAAEIRFLNRVEQTLKRRYENERTFKL